MWRPLVVESASLAQEPFQIVVSAVIKTETLTGDLALDDWTFPPGCSFYTGEWNSSTRSAVRGFVSDKKVTSLSQTSTTGSSSKGTSSSTPRSSSTTDTTITPTSSGSTISAGESESHSHTTVIISVIVIVLTVVLAGIGFGYFRIRRRSYLEN